MPRGLVLTQGPVVCQTPFVYLDDLMFMFSMFS